MRNLMEAAASINAKLAVLNEKAGNINQVVTTITKVADETNLPSLDAAIEAEKAGQYRPGCAVVATEIAGWPTNCRCHLRHFEQTVKEMHSAVSAGSNGDGQVFRGSPTGACKKCSKPATVDANHRGCAGADAAV